MIAKDAGYLVKAAVSFQEDGQESILVTVTFANFNDGIEITAPA